MTTEEIISHAWKLFSIVPYEQASLRSISEQAGVSSSLLSYLFGTKEALWYQTVRSVMDPLYQQFIDELDHLAKQPRTGLIEVKQLMRLCIDRTLAEPIPFKFLYREGEGSSQRAKFLRDTYLLPYQQKVYAVYHDACMNTQQQAMDSVTFLTFYLSIVRFIFFPSLLMMLLPESEQNNTSIRELLDKVLDQLLPHPTDQP